MLPYLNDSEKMALERFNADAYAVEAVRKVILWRIYNDGILEPGVAAEPMRNFMLNIVDAVGHDLSDEELGSLTRARRIATELLETGMKDVGKFKRADPQKPREPDHR